MKSLLATAIAALMAFGITAHADLITGITLEDWDGTTPNYPNMGPLKAINGEGLPGNTPALSGTHGNTWTQHWYSSLKTGAWITVDLEANYAVDTIHVWNENENNAGRLRGMKNVEIYVSPDENVDHLVKLITDGTGTQDNGSGDFLFPIGEGLTTYTGFDLDLSGVTNAALLENVRLVRIMNLDNHGSNGGSGLAEVQFGGSVPAGFALTSIGESGADLVLTWESQAGKVYDILGTTDLTAAPSTWTALVSDIATTPPENTETFPKPVDPDTCLMVLEKPLPPLFEDDFESDLGWAVGVDAGTDTDWERGTPSAIGPAAANSPVTCYGTNIDAAYGIGVNISLRSPAIDLSAATAATLTFQQFYDIEAGFDAGAVRVLKSSDLTQLGADIVNPVDGTVTEWTEFTGALPAEALGETVILEFRFTSDGFAPSAQAGWYIDDVSVTVE